MSMRSSTAGMSAQQPDALCSDWPGVSGDIVWGTGRVFSVGGKMFVTTSIDGGERRRLPLKVANEHFYELTDQPGVIPAPYLARAHWISVVEPQRFATSDLVALVPGAYTLVRAQPTK